MGDSPGGLRDEFPSTTFEERATVEFLLRSNATGKDDGDVRVVHLSPGKYNRVAIDLSATNGISISSVLNLQLLLNRNGCRMVDMVICPTRREIKIAWTKKKPGTPVFSSVEDLEKAEDAPDEQETALTWFRRAVLSGSPFGPAREKERPSGESPFVHLSGSLRHQIEESTRHVRPSLRSEPSLSERLRGAPSRILTGLGKSATAVKRAVSSGIGKRSRTSKGATTTLAFWNHHPRLFRCEHESAMRKTPLSKELQGLSRDLAVVLRTIRGGDSPRNQVVTLAYTAGECLVVSTRLRHRLSLADIRSAQRRIEACCKDFEGSSSDLRVDFTKQEREVTPIAKLRVVVKNV